MGIQIRAPEQFARIWIHTHPGDCARPSPTDEDTFSRCFGHADWAVMFILAESGATYARLQFNVGPTVSVQLEVDVEFEPEFAAAEPDVWEREYEDCVFVRDPFAMLESSWPAAASDSDDADAPVEDFADTQADLARAATEELQAAQEILEFDRCCSASLSEQDLDDWYERWMAEAVFDPEVSEAADEMEPIPTSTPWPSRKEEPWRHHLSAATG